MNKLVHKLNMVRQDSHLSSSILFNILSENEIRLHKQINKFKNSKFKIGS